MFVFFSPPSSPLPLFSFSLTFFFALFFFALFIYFSRPGYYSTCSKSYVIHEQRETGSTVFSVRSQPVYPGCFNPEELARDEVRIWIALFQDKNLREELKKEQPEAAVAGAERHLVAFKSEPLGQYKEGISIEFPNLAAGRYVSVMGITCKPCASSLTVQGIGYVLYSTLSISVMSTKPCASAPSSVDEHYSDALHTVGVRMALKATRAIEALPLYERLLYTWPYLDHTARLASFMTGRFFAAFMPNLEGMTLALLASPAALLITHPFTRFSYLQAASLAQDVPLNAGLRDALTTSATNAWRELTHVDPRNVGGRFDFLNVAAPLRGSYDLYCTVYRPFPVRVLRVRTISIVISTVAVAVIILMFTLAISLPSLHLQSVGAFVGSVWWSSALLYLKGMKEVATQDPDIRNNTFAQATVPVLKWLTYGAFQSKFLATVGEDRYAKFAFTTTKGTLPRLHTHTHTHRH